MQKIVIDTNVVVSALIGDGYSRQIIYDLAFNKKVIICLSFEIFFEYFTVLNREKFSKYPEFITKAEIVLNTIDDISLKYLPTVKIDKIKDETDNKFLELGITAVADFIITGNTKDFTFQEYYNMKVVTPQEYINKFYR